jgi:VCBS repeat-containing protein
MRQVVKRSAHLMMALEPRWMFDGAAAVDAAHAAADAAAHALIPVTVSPVEVRAADPTKDSGKKEVAFVDTSIAGYQVLEAGIHDGIAIVEIAGGQSGLAQMAQWAESHSGFDAIHILSHGAEGQINIGSDVITDASLSTAVVQAELAEIGHALKAGGDLLIYGCDVAKGADGLSFISDLSAGSGADVAASTDITGAAAKGGNWTLESSVGAIDVPVFAITNWNDLLGNVTDFFAPATNIGGELTTSSAIFAVKPGSYGETFYITGIADGTTVSLFMHQTSSWDPYLIIRNGADAEIAFNDDSGGSLDSYIPSITWNSNYTIVATAYSGFSTGTYTLYASAGVLHANSAPVAVGDTATSVEAGGVANGTAGTNPTGNVLTNDTDVDVGDTKTVTALSGGTLGSAMAGSYGSLTLASDGSYTYTVDDSNTTVQGLRTSANTLTDSFTYTMRDRGGLTSSTTLEVTIQGANDAPVAVADAATAVEAGGVANGTAGTNPTGNVLTNDTDVDTGDTKTVTALAGGTLGSAKAGSYGSLTLNADGSYSYAVDNTNATVEALRTSAQTLSDSFTYTMRDTAGLTSVTTLTVTIQGANDAPVAINDTASATEKGGYSNGTAGSNGTGNVLTNDTDVDTVANGETKTVSAITGGTVGSAKAGNYGTLTLNSDGSYAYVISEANVTVQALRLSTDTLTDSFTYTLRDAAGVTSTATLTVTVHGANDAPAWNYIIPNQTWVGGGSKSYTILPNTFSDIDTADVLSYTASPTLPGWMTIDSATGMVSGIIPMGAKGVAQVTVTAHDLGGLTAVAETFLISYDNPAPPAATVAAEAPIALAKDPVPLPPKAPDVTMVRAEPGQSDAKAIGMQTVMRDAVATKVSSGDSLAALSARSSSDAGSTAISAKGSDSSAAVSSAISAPSDGGFRVSVSATGSEPIVASKAIGEVVQVGKVAFTIPVDAFAVTKADAQVTLRATQADGSPLPSWLKFNPVSGQLEGTPPAGQAVDIDVKVSAHGKAGGDAAQIFRLSVKPDQGANGGSAKLHAFNGKVGLSEQIRMAKAGPGRFTTLANVMRQISGRQIVGGRAA